MAFSLQTIRQRFPIRRRRLWRYVSPRRRGVGLLVLAFLLLGLYGYWRLTNDHRIRHQAETYLHQLTGGRVRVGGAHFSFFGGIELQNVRMYVPGDSSPDPFFAAPKVLLRHYPWGLFVNGRLEPVEVVCAEPVVTLERDTATDTFTIQKLFAMAQRPAKEPARAQPPRLPVITFLSAHLRHTEATAQLRQVLSEEKLDISMVPREGGLYTITLEQQRSDGQASISGSIVLNLATGERKIFGRIPLQGLDGALPAKYSQWRKLYDVRGKVLLNEAAATPGVTQLELVDVSLRLPESQGGLELEHVNGTMLLDLSERGGLTIPKVTGRVPQCNNAVFELSGQYDGYEGDSPFSLTLDAPDMTLPEPGTLSGAGADLMAYIERVYQLRGSMGLHMELKRQASGDVNLTGKVELKGMSMAHKVLPYRLGDITGQVVFTQDTVELRDIVCHNGPAVVTITGTVDPAQGGRVFDVLVQGRQIPLNDEIRNALPKEEVWIYDDLSPQGSASVDVTIRSLDGKKEQIGLKFLLSGQTSVMYAGFPYRVNDLVGRATVEDGCVTIEPVTGRAGPMQCRVTGAIHFGGKTDIDLSVRAWNMPLDETLNAALNPQGRELMELLAPSGRASSMLANIRVPAGGELSYEVMATLADVSLRPSGFPYTIDGVRGNVHLTPGKVGIEGLVGRHRQATLKGDGELRWGEQNGLSLYVQASDMSLDQELYDALPTEARQLWDKLSPSGMADLALKLNKQVVDGVPTSDYDFRLDARGMGLCYNELPYPLRNVRGTFMARPGHLDMVDVSAGEGDTRLTLSGRIDTGDDGDHVALTAQAKSLPIDSSLLGAMTGDLALAASGFAPGGTLDLSLSRIEMARRARKDDAPILTQPATRTATGPSSRPQTQPAPWEEFLVEGSATVHEAVMDAGLGAKTVTGGITGSIVKASEGVSVNANIDLDSITVGPRQLTDIHGQLTKAASSQMLRLDDLSARAYGGALAGMAQWRLGSESEYGLSMMVTNVRLNELFNAGIKDPTQKSDVQGLLVGNLQMTGVVGKPSLAKGAGVLQVADGKLYKLPVLLGLLNVVFLTLPGDSAFHDGQIIYRVSDGRLVFDEIHFTGATLSIVGSGTMDTGTERIRLSFLTAPAGKMPRLGGLTGELLGPLLRQIAEIRVTGTIAKPRMRTVTLGSVDEMVRELTTPEAHDQRR